MTSRRDFLQGMASFSLASTTVFRETAIGSLFRANAIAGDRRPDELADDEVYWSEIQRAFDTDRTMINLNNGGCSPTPTHVLEAMIRDLRFTNELPVEHMWRVLEPRVESVRRDLAREFGCDPEEMAITRNASESNEIMIMGLDLKRGDEVVVTNQNYGRMIATWQQRERREGIVLKQVSFKVPPPSIAFNALHRRADHRGGYAEDAGDRVSSHYEPHRADDAGPGDSRFRPAEGNRSIDRWCPRVRAFPLHAG